MIVTRKICYSFCFFFVNCFLLTAQIYTPGAAVQGSSSSDNVGIGTALPSQKLTVEAAHHNTRLLLHSTGGGSEDRQADLMLWASEPGWTHTGAGIGNNVKNEYSPLNGLAINRFNLARGGSYIRLLDNEMTFNLVSSAGIDKNVVNINNSGLFTIYESALIRSTLSVGKQEAAANTAGEIVRLSLRPFGHVGGSWNFKARDISGYAFLDFAYGTANAMTISSALNIGIGTTTPDEKLTVKGKIHTQEVRVDMAGPLVPDYVFAPDYDLKPLSEVAQYIKENRHLPEIPSAKEIEANGLHLAEMNMKLLKKIEELTLYVMEQDKKNKEVLLLFKKQEQRIKQLEKKSTNHK